MLQRRRGNVTEVCVSLSENMFPVVMDYLWLKWIEPGVQEEGFTIAFQKKRLQFQRKLVDSRHVYWLVGRFLHRCGQYMVIHKPVWSKTCHYKSMGVINVTHNFHHFQPWTTSVCFCLLNVFYSAVWVTTFYWNKSYNFYWVQEKKMVELVC